jgi:hypothetical protein
MSSYKLFDRSGVEDDGEEFLYDSSTSSCKMDIEEEEVQQQTQQNPIHHLKVLMNETKKRLRSPTSPTEFFQKLKVRKVVSSILEEVVLKTNADSVLVKCGRTRTLEEALEDPSQTTCSKCGAIIPKSRISVHLALWCEKETQDFITEQ